MDSHLLLSVRDLKTYFRQDEGVVKAVDGASFDVPVGKTVGIVGESGCGKSVTARSILRIVERPGRIESGEIWLNQADGDGSATGIDLAELDPNSPRMRSIRGGVISLVFQEPMTSFSPVHTVGNQIIEAIRLHLNLDAHAARARAVELFQQVGIPRPEERLDTYAYQLSGGLRQRAMIAMALAADPKLLIADEPTTALDVTTQAQILDLLRRLQQEKGMAIMLITHDLGVIAEMADEVVVMYLGRVVERGPVDEIFHAPKHPYTRALLRSIPSVQSTPRTKLPTIAGSIPHPYNRPTGCPYHPRCESYRRGVCEKTEPDLRRVGSRQWASCFLYDEGAVGHQPAAAGGSPAISAPMRLELRPTLSTEVAATANGQRAAANGAPALLEVRNLQKFFPIKKGFLRRTVGQVRAVDDVSFTIQPGETLALVGESGCGKTTTSRCILRAVDPTGGEILFRTEGGATVDVARLPKPQLRPLRRQMQMIFQDPYSSLNPRMTLLDIVGEPLLVNGVANRQERIDRVERLLKLVGMRPEFMRRYPHAFSGGQRQRIGIARALALNPSLVVADEPVSALDVSVQAQILNLLLDLQQELGLTYLFVAHDLSVVKHISDRVAVMYVGKIVELADRDRLFFAPRHPYTAALMSAAPVADPRAQLSRIPLPGEVANPSAPPTGCYFHPRCQFAIDRCKVEAPVWQAVADGHWVRCHRAKELSLPGIARV